MSELNIAIVGHIDHGKSTLLGRLLFDTDNISKSKKEGLNIDVVDNINFAYLLDSFEQEQKQGKTINSMRVAVDINNRSCIFFDVPGHAEYIDRMITSISKVDYALIVIDVLQGIQEQTIHHLNILSLFEVRNITVVINKMDRINCSKEQFSEIEKQINKICKELRINIDNIIPISAQKGINVVKNQNLCKWYTGLSVIESLISMKIEKETSRSDFVFSVQDIYEISGVKYIAGKVLSGSMDKGSDEVLNIINKEKYKIINIKNNSGDCINEINRGDLALVQLNDEANVKRGDILMDGSDIVYSTKKISLDIVWTGDEKYDESKQYYVNVATQAASCQIVLQKELYINKNRKNKDKGNLFKGIVALDNKIAVSKYDELDELGTVTILNKGTIVAIGIVSK
ncbi:MAG: GTP-binding protein [Candidatus Moraniibacteriota bacterium]|jgi:small GTP-binding protein